MSKPKEFYIKAKHRWYGDFYECYTEASEEKSKLIRVIEYSAYEQLKKENKELRERLIKYEKKALAELNKIEDKKSKYICYVTPTSFDKVKDKLSAKYSDIEIISSTDIYINMTGGWTSEECDNTAYIVEREPMERKLDISAFLKENK